MSQLIYETVLSKFWDCGKLPIDPRIIAGRAGIEVVSIGGGESDCTGTPVVGSYRPGDRDQKTIIGVDESQSSVRVRFTIAHELGHHFHHHFEAMHTDTPKSFLTSNAEIAEMIANGFAQQLLMPAQYVKVVVERMKMTDLNALTKTFGVSEVAMEMRLRSLKMIR